MIQDIAPHRFNNHFEPGHIPSVESPVYCFHQRKLLVRVEEDMIVLPAVQDLPAGTPVQYLFTLDDTDYFRADTRSCIPEPDGFEYRVLRALRDRNIGPQHLIFAAVTALHLDTWYRDNRYCGTCGHPTVHSETERALVCPQCGRTIYPRIVPAVIVGGLNGNKLLVTRYADRPGLVRYNALIAGFTEIGETLEETVAREVMEEVGLRVKNIRYYKSQPWGFADDILAGFFCDLDGDDTLKVDYDELKVAFWLTPEDLELQPHDYSLTNDMMKQFKNGKFVP